MCMCVCVCVCVCYSPHPHRAGWTLYLESVHEALPVAGSSPGDVGQRLALGHAGDHGGAAVHGGHVLQLRDVGLDWKWGEKKKKTEIKL